LCYVSGALLLAVGYGLLGLAHDLLAVLSAAVTVGVGLSLTQAALPAAVARLVPLALRRRAFTSRYLIMNVGLGVGAAIGGVAVASVSSVTVFRELYLGDVLSYVPLALIVYAVVPKSSRPGARKADRSPGYWNLMRSPVVVLLVSVSALIGLFGYTQFEASVPLLVHTRMGLSASIAGGVVTLNTLAVITLQRPVTRHFERYSESVVLMLAPACFAVAFCFGLVAALLHGSPRIAVLAGFPVVFALGEAAYSSSFQPLMVKTAPGNSLGQVSGLCGLISGVCAVAGPAFGILLISHLSPLASWAALAAAVLIAFALAALLHRVLARTPGRAPESGTSHSPGPVTAASGGAA
jgi:MFS family permease